jgi:hypothetical protein
VFPLCIPMYVAAEMIQYSVSAGFPFEQIL